uniref:Uncharacterized protein n=1 Tax=Arundo donax TaxID=35708 RepID=A0A0A9EPU6_ARUDO
MQESKLVEPVGVVAVGEGHLPACAGGERAPPEVVPGQRRVILRRPGRWRCVPRPLPHRRRVPVVNVQAQRLRRRRSHGDHKHRSQQRRHTQHGEVK